MCTAVGAMYERMRGSRRRWDDLLEATHNEQQQLLNCSCEISTDDHPALSGWRGHHVSPWSAHVTGIGLGSGASGWEVELHKTSHGCQTRAKSCKSDNSRTTFGTKDHTRTTNDHCRTTFGTKDHSRATFGTKNPRTTIGTKTVHSSGKTKTNTSTNYQTSHSKQTHLPLQTTTTQAKHTATTSNQTVPKQTTSTSNIYKDVPDIPFDVKQIHNSTTLYRDVHTSRAHIQHYIMLYTYPQLEQRLALSLPPPADVSLCSVCSAAGVCGVCEGVEGGGGERVRPSIIEVLIEESVLSSPQLSQPQSMYQHRSRRGLPVIGSTTLSQTELSSGLPRGPKPPQQLLPSLTRDTTHNTRDHTTTNNNKLDNITQRGGSNNAQGKRIYNRNRVSSLPSAKTGNRSKKKQLPSKGTAHSVSQSVYDMGVRWTPETFPPLVVSSTHTQSTSKPTLQALSRSARAKHKSNNARKSHKVDESGGSLDMLIVSATSLHEHRTISTQKDEHRGRQEAIKTVALEGRAKPANTLAKTLSPFQVQKPISLRNEAAHTRSLRNEAGHTNERAIPERSGSQYWLLGDEEGSRREVDECKRRGKVVSVRGKSDRVLETLCLKGQSAGRRGGREGREFGEEGREGEEGVWGRRN